MWTWSHTKTATECSPNQRPLTVAVSPQLLTQSTPNSAGFSRGGDKRCVFTHVQRHGATSFVAEGVGMVDDESRGRDRSHNALYDTGVWDMSECRRPRLPQRLLGEVTRNGRPRVKGEGEHRGGPLRRNRKEIRSAARREKKRKKCENVALFRVRLQNRKRQQYAKHQSAKDVSVRSSISKEKTKSESEDRVTPHSARHEKAPQREAFVAAEDDPRRDSLARAYEEEKRNIEMLAKKLKRAKQVDITLVGVFHE